MIRTKLLDVQYGFTDYKDIDDLINEFIEENPQIEIIDIKYQSKSSVERCNDTLVTIIVLAHQLDLDVTECLGIAYEEIKNRNGKMINGTFVKEEDL